MMSLLPTPDLQWPPLRKFFIPRKYYQGASALTLDGIRSARHGP